jgi:hypothetical protein
VDIETSAGAMRLRLPQIYQVIGGARRPVEGSYVLESANVIGFRLAGYDKTRPLVIDPTLVYGSYLGTGFGPTAVTTDTSGNIYVAGNGAPGLATVSAHQPGDLTTNVSCFLMKLDPTAATVLYSTYIGGSNYSQLEGIAVDSAGEVVGTGSTGASDFPLVNAAWPTFDAVDNQSAIVFKLNANGSGFIYSTYLSSVLGFAVALDGSRNAYVTGDTYATGAATSGVWQTSYGGGFNDAFVAKLTAAGAITYFTFLGGSGYDQGIAIAADSSGDAYVAGYTNSVSFPGNPPGVHTANAGGYDAFIAEVSPNASSVTWLTFLGGTGNETTTGMVRDKSSGMLYVAGSTTSTDLPTTAGVIQPSAKGPEQGFIASLNQSGAFGFVTYLGGRKVDIINAITEASSTQLVVAGTSSSSNLISEHAIQPAFAGNSVSLFEGANYGGSGWTGEDTGLPAQVTSLTGDPSSASTLLALSNSPLSVFRTTNGGSSWVAEPLDAQLWYFETPPQFARSPVDSSTVYAYLPFAGGPPPNDFVFKSTDDGVTWTSLANPPVSPTDYLDGLALSVTNANTLTEVFYSGAVYQSTDGGATFSALPSLPGGACYVAWVGPLTSGADGSIYLGNYSGICKSTDGGSTWSQLPSSSAIGYTIAIAASASAPSTLYAMSGGGSVYASTNGGSSWSAGSFPGGQVTMLAVAPSNSHVVYAAGSGGVFYSTNNAATWSPASSLAFPPNAIAVNLTHPNVVYAAGVSTTDGFVAKLNTAGTSLLWSTFYSGSNSVSGTSPTSVAPAASGNVWIAGSTYSTDLPITASPYSNLGNSFNGAGFLARISDTTAACSYLLNPPSLYAYSAATLEFSVTAPSGCAWTAIPSAPSWMTIATGATGTASGIVSTALTANTTGATRNGTVDINGQLFSITQAASTCTYSLSSSGSLPASGGTVQITVTAPSGCPWSVVLPSSFISIVSGASGTGNGTVTLSLPANHSVQWFSPVVQVGPQSIALSEADICSYSLSPQTLGAQAASGSIAVTANHAGCSWTAQLETANTPWLTVSGNGTGSGSFSYTVQANTGTAGRAAVITLDNRQFEIKQSGT